MSYLVFVDHQEGTRPTSVRNRTFLDEPHHGNRIWRFNEELAYWIRDQLGYEIPDLHLKWDPNRWSWYFTAKTLQDAMMFKLTWGGL